MMEAVEKATASLTATSAATLGYLSPTEPWEIAAVEPPFKQFKLPPLPLVDVPSAPHVTLSNWTSPQKRAAYRQLLRHQQPNRTQQQQVRCQFGQILFACHDCQRPNLHRNVTGRVQIPHCVEIRMHFTHVSE
eukprot:TRINITY_DN7691_c0_g1_i4.p3 TRINITY_DN7691_c0_g1~~TRINITY_DN7691_c0_g1_i4.p3  ORF type:complete len:133 (+),score=13.46 TRINITY_DN7691_c0_g1_i4:562-960(+)